MARSPRQEKMVGEAGEEARLPQSFDRVAPCGCHGAQRGRGCADVFVEERARSELHGTGRCQASLIRHDDDLGACPADIRDYRRAAVDDNEGLRGFECQLRLVVSRNDVHLPASTVMDVSLYVCCVGGLSECLSCDGEEPGGAFGPGFAFQVLQRFDEPCRPIV